MNLLSTLQEAVSRAPDDGEALAALGVALAHRGEFAEAIAYLRRSVDVRPQDATMHHVLAYLLRRAPGFEREVTFHLERAFALEPDSLRAGDALASWYADFTDREEEARALCVRMIAADPHQPRPYAILWRGHLADGELEAMWPLVERLLPSGGRHDLLEMGLVRALVERGRYRAARACLVRLAEAERPVPHVLALLGCVENVLGDPAAARVRYEQALRQRPSDGGFLNQYLTLLWQVGDYDAVRRTLRSEPALDGMNIAPTARLWDLSAVRGRTVLLKQEDPGFGDNLHWSRLAPFLAEAGARVVVECFSPVRQLVETMPGVDAVVTPYDCYPPIDTVVNPVHGLGMIDWTWPSFESHVPCLRITDVARERWRARLQQLTHAAPAAAALRGERARGVEGGNGHTLHVGLEWLSETEHRKDDPYTRRSASFADLTPLISLPGVTCHSLHVGRSGLEEMRAHPMGGSVTPLSDGIRDFVDTAGAVSAMDAVVTVDTSVVHVAGGLGKPTFLLLPYRGDWRWGDVDTPTRWYPSCRVFRQSRPGDWAPAVAQVAGELRARQCA